jgi:hypothetical protein
MFNVDCEGEWNIILGITTGCLICI